MTIHFTLPRDAKGRDIPRDTDVMYDINGIGHIAAGSLGGDDVGMKCFHGKTGVVEILLNHLVEKEHEYVVVDMTAGADWFSSGMFFKFDAVFIVVEPTLATEVYVLPPCV